jgi:four helix bundle protein
LTIIQLDKDVFCQNILDYEDLPVWQDAALLYCSVLDLLEESSNHFSFGFRTQLDRASLSVSNNIAEGFERMSTAELLAFLEFARGSAGEVRSMVAVIRRRMKVRAFGKLLDLIRGQAESAICYFLFLYRRYFSDGQSDHPR